MVRGAVFAGAAVLVLALAGCGPSPSATASSSTATTQSTQSMQAGIAAALDPCAPNNPANGFARKVCADGSLAALDGQIRTALAQRASQISADGQRILVDAEQKWREAQRVACGLSAPDAQPNATQQQCLENRFRARMQEASSVVQNINGYVFQRVENVAAAPTPQRLVSTGADPAITTDIRYPRIDGQQTPQAQRFNRLVAQSPQFRPDQNTNETVRYTISYAGPELISVRFDMNADTPGAAQNNTNVKAVNVVMATGQPLSAADVFKPNSGWENFLTQRAVADLAHQYADYNFTPPSRDVHETVTRPNLWLITAQSLVLLFPPLSFGGSYDMASAQVAIPWTDLRPYLNPNAPAPIRPQA